jgi:uracil phosphoribosyltransferase
MNRQNLGITVIDHPVAQAALARLRDRSTPSEQFRMLLRRISFVMACEVSRSLATVRIRLRTPLESTSGVRLRDGVVLVPILRAGLGMVDGFLEVLPDAKVGHIGLARDEKTLKPETYYRKVPRSLKSAVTIVLDPMLATGGSARAAISELRNCGAGRISIASIVAAPEGVEAVRRADPDVKLFTCSVDRGLNRNGYILPGLGDAGDRSCGTD